MLTFGFGFKIFHRAFASRLSTTSKLHREDTFHVARINKGKRLEKRQEKDMHRTTDTEIRMHLNFSRRGRPNFLQRL